MERKASCCSSSRARPPTRDTTPARRAGTGQEPAQKPAAGLCWPLWARTTLTQERRVGRGICTGLEGGHRAALSRDPPFNLRAQMQQRKPPSPRSTVWSSSGVPRAAPRHKRQWGAGWGQTGGRQTATVRLSVPGALPTTGTWHLKENRILFIKILCQSLSRCRVWGTLWVTFSSFIKKGKHKTNSSPRNRGGSEETMQSNRDSSLQVCDPQLPSTDLVRGLSPTEESQQPTKGPHLSAKVRKPSPRVRRSPPTPAAAGRAHSSSKRDLSEERRFQPISQSRWPLPSSTSISHQASFFCFVLCFFFSFPKSEIRMEADRRTPWELIRTVAENTKKVLRKPTRLPSVCDLLGRMSAGPWVLMEESKQTDKLRMLSPYTERTWEWEQWQSFSQAFYPSSAVEKGLHWMEKAPEETLEALRQGTGPHTHSRPGCVPVSPAQRTWSVGHVFQGRVLKCPHTARAISFSGALRPWQKEEWPSSKSLRPPKSWLGRRFKSKLPEGKGLHRKYRNKGLHHSMGHHFLIFHF